MQRTYTVAMNVPYWKTAVEKYSISRIEGMSPTEAAKEAKLPPSIIKNPSRVESKHQELIRDCLPKVGGDSYNVALTIAQALKASKSDGEPDHRIRLDASRLIAQVTGQLDTSTKVAVQVNLSGKIADWLAVDAGAPDDDGPLGGDIDGPDSADQ